jgi:hypothetical protein
MGFHGKLGNGNGNDLELSITHDGSMVLVYANMTGVYGWDPCYHI